VRVRWQAVEIAGVNRPFAWTFTRAKLNAIFEKITRHEPRPLALVA
jgi:hypothetical protein